MQLSCEVRKEAIKVKIAAYPCFILCLGTSVHVMHDRGRQTVYGGGLVTRFISVCGANSPVCV